MAEMRINTQEIRDTATKISTLRGEIINILNEFATKVTNLQESWESEASTETMNGINALKPKFDNYSAVVDSYVTYLNTTAESYEATEATNKQNATTTGEFI